ncbi:MAG: 4-hydroxy-tetrahydrodipicolinate reductase [bacterium]|nr:4-hydroxy-tetrahydrodipicolinate reductase [bacterium]
MVRAIMHGCNGRMGQMIVGLVDGDSEIEIVAGIDTYTEQKNGFPVYATLAECKEEADVIIDFCNAGAVDALLAYSVEKNIPVVLCSTGLSEEQLQAVAKASEQVAILKSANMSLGVNTLMDLLQKAVKVFAPAGFDVEIVERHHNQKLDAPSGTALALADSINEAMDGQYEYVYDRSDRRQKRAKNELGISAVRGGSIVGDHEVIFAGADEVIEFKHTAYSRAVFGKGAVEAAKFLAGKPAGHYEMRDVIAARN